MKLLTRKNRIRIVLLLCLCTVCASLLAVNTSKASYTNETRMMTTKTVDTKYFYSNCLYADYPMVLLPDWTVGSETIPGTNIVLGANGWNATARIYCETSQSNYVKPYFVYQGQKYGPGSAFEISLNQGAQSIPIYFEPVESAVEELTGPKTVYVDVKCTITMSTSEKQDISAEFVLNICPAEEEVPEEGEGAEAEAESGEGTSGQTEESVEGQAAAEEDAVTAQDVSAETSAAAVADVTVTENATTEADSTSSNSVSGGDSVSDSVSDGDAEPQKLGMSVQGSLTKGSPLLVNITYEDYPETVEEGEVTAEYKEIHLYLLKADKDGNLKEVNFPAFTRYYEQGADCSYIPAYYMPIELKRGDKTGTQLMLDFSQANIAWEDSSWQLKLEIIKTDDTVESISVPLQMYAAETPALEISTNAQEPIVTKTENLSWIVKSGYTNFELTIEKLTADGYFPVLDDNYLQVIRSQENPAFPGQYEITISSCDGMARAGTYRMTIKQYYGLIKISEKSVPFFINYR